MLAALTATTPAARSSAQVKLSADLATLDKQRSRHRRDLDRGQENHGRDRGVSQPADLGTARLVNR